MLISALCMRQQLAGGLCPYARWTKPGFALASLTLPTFCSTDGNQLAASTSADTTSAGLRSMRLGIQMLLALEINFALWGMTICATMKAAEFFEVF
jgi:hypothetical protein